MALTTMLQILGKGALVSVEIFFSTLIISLPLGLIVAFGRMSKNKILSSIARVFISVLRGTPLMLQLFLVYFGPYYLFKVSSLDRLVAVIIAFGINYAAYFAEIYRGGIESIPQSQYEAAKVLGYNKSQTFIHIIFPQVIKRIIPSITNEVITLIKDTSLAFTLSVAEMFTQARAIAASQKSMVPYVIAAVFYYIFNFVVATVMERVEDKFNFYGKDEK